MKACVRYIIWNIDTVTSCIYKKNWMHNIHRPRTTYSLNEPLFNKIRKVTRLRSLPRGRSSKRRSCRTTGGSQAFLLSYRPETKRNTHRPTSRRRDRGPVSESNARVSGQETRAISISPPGQDGRCGVNPGLTGTASAPWCVSRSRIAHFSTHVSLGLQRELGLLIYASVTYRSSSALRATRRSGNETQDKNYAASRDIVRSEMRAPTSLKYVARVTMWRSGNDDGAGRSRGACAARNYFYRTSVARSALV